MAPRRSGRLKPIPAACLASTPEVNDANKKRVSLDCLPDALLLQVLASIEPSQGAERREVLPLVCKRWSALLQAPSAVWEVRMHACLLSHANARDVTVCAHMQSLVVDFCHKDAPHKRLLRSAVQGWMESRGSAVRNLTLKNSSADSTHSFSRNGKSLENMFLAVADGLQSLEVNNCNDIFTPATFDYLPLLEQLTRLHIISCRQRFPARSFLGLAGIKGLQDLKIAGDTDYENVLTINCINSFPEDLLSLRQLTSLSLSSRGLTDLPEGISALSQLQKLSLDGCCNLKPLPSSICSLDHLQELSLNDIAGSLLLDSIRNLALEKLSLRKSNVHVLPASFTNCSIKQLDVSHNPFTGNAGSYLGQYQLLDLEVLNLSFCEMETLPCNPMHGFVTLKALDLGNNGMVDLPDSLSRLTNLECLNLQGNCFPQMPQVLQKLKSLCCLSMVACNYLEIPCWDTISSLAKWPRLRTIWMWKTDGVEYQDYSKAALQQLKTKLKRKRTRDVSVCYERQDAPDLNFELTMHGLTSAVTLSK